MEQLRTEVSENYTNLVMQQCETNKVLIEIFLGYCKNGVIATHRESLNNKYAYKTLCNIKYEIGNNNLMLYSFRDKDKISINNLNTYDMEEHDEYLLMKNKNTREYIIIEQL